jgi:hypothetical protein
MDDQEQPGLLKLLHDAGAAFRDLSAALNRAGAVEAEQLQIEGGHPVIHATATVLRNEES